MGFNFIVETSARHIHVSREHLDVLYGKGHKLTIKKELSQPGQYACEEKLTVVGPKGELKMTILGPERKETQIEVSYTDARALGIVPPVRESGDIKGSSPVKLVGPAGEIELSEGAIVAMRHIHMTPEDAEKAGVKDKDIVNVKIDTPRGLIFSNTVVRVSPSYGLAMHIDTDEANAAGISGVVYGEIVK